MIPPATQTTPQAREELLAAREDVSSAFQRLDRLAGQLPALEASAVLALKAELVEVCRRLDNIAVYVGAQVRREEP